MSSPRPTCGQRQLVPGPRECPGWAGSRQPSPGAIHIEGDRRAAPSQVGIEPNVTGAADCETVRFRGTGIFLRFRLLSFQRQAEPPITDT